MELDSGGGRLFRASSGSFDLLAQGGLILLVAVENLLNERSGGERGCVEAETL